jgi:hypothetical protein
MEDTARRVSIVVDLPKMLGPFKPIYNWFGYDEGNYTTLYLLMVVDFAWTNVSGSAIAECFSNQSDPVRRILLVLEDVGIALGASGKSSKVTYKDTRRRSNC